MKTKANKNSTYFFFVDIYTFSMWHFHNDFERFWARHLLFISCSFLRSHFILLEFFFFFFCIEPCIGKIRWHTHVSSLFDMRFERWIASIALNLLTIICTGHGNFSPWRYERKSLRLNGRSFSLPPHRTHVIYIRYINTTTLT